MDLLIVGGLCQRWRDSEKGMSRERNIYLWNRALGLESDCYTTLDRHWEYVAWLSMTNRSNTHPIWCISRNLIFTLKVCSRQKL